MMLLEEERAFIRENVWIAATETACSEEGRRAMLTVLLNWCSDATEEALKTEAKLQHTNVDSIKGTKEE